MLLMYQIKVGLCLIAFYLLWKLLLSRETFHRFNRIAILAVMALALVLPWIRFSLKSPSPVTDRMIILEDMIITPSGAVQAQQVAQPWNIMDLFTIAYFVGMAMVLVWLLYGQWNLWRQLKQGRTELLPDGVTLHVLPNDISPFSYFKHIVISEQDYRDNPREILVHEQAHIDLRHSWDVMFTSLLTLFQWWNPAAWLLCRELKQVHEYEADEAVINENVDVKQYQLLLIRKSVGDQLFSMANNFNYQSLKKRIRMMTINKSSQWKRLWALAAVPVIALALLAFANPNTDAAVAAANPASVNPTPQTQVAVEKTETGKMIYHSVEQMPEFPGGAAALMRYLMENVKYPENAAKNNIEGRVIVQFVIDENGEIGEVKVVRPVNEELDAEAVRVTKSLPKFEPGRQNGEAVAVWYTLPIIFKIQGDKPTPF